MPWQSRRSGCSRLHSNFGRALFRNLSLRVREQVLGIVRGPDPAPRGRADRPLDDLGLGGQDGEIICEAGTWDEVRCTASSGAMK